MQDTVIIFKLSRTNVLPSAAATRLVVEAVVVVEGVVAAAVKTVHV